MCGICGLIDPAGAQAADCRPMLAAIAHRGPDDEGVWVNGRVALGSRRLSIIDLPGGHQPIANEDETIWITFNGEIYNHPPLRQELLQKGHIFRTASDTEVILHLYEEMGERCVERLNGMFAFAIWDTRQQKLVLARDRIGQKPLFYAWDGDRFLFASEIKAILAASRQPRQMNLEAMHHYLSLRFIPSPQTMLHGVYKLPPAHALVLQNGQMTTSRYWDLSFREKLTLSESEFLDGLRHKLAQTVADHMISDVPVGAFLSGGMDSSMVVAVMAQDCHASFQTFAIGVTEQDFNELPYARAVAAYHETQHVEATVHSDLIASLPHLIWNLDEPSDPIAACQYQAAALAAQHVKVVLGGDGGDELFAGFDRYLGLNYVNAYAKLPGFLRRGVVGPALRHWPDSFAYKSVTQKARWLHQLSLLPDTAMRYAEATCFFRFSHADKQALYGDGLWTQLGNINSSEVIAHQFRAADATNDLDRMLYADYMTRLTEHSLLLTDRMTMAHSLELRSPFLDHELVEYVAAFPTAMKIHGRQLKYILRRLAADYLPPAIIARPKQGFMFPVAYWFRDRLSGFLEQVLLDSTFVREGLFRREAISGLITEHRQGQVDHHVRLWQLLNLSLWHEIYVTQAAPAALEAELKALM